MFRYDIVSDRKSLCWISNCGVVKDLKPVEDHPQAFSLILETELNEESLNWALGELPVIKSLIVS